MKDSKEKIILPKMKTNKVEKREKTKSLSKPIFVGNPSLLPLTVAEDHLQHLDTRVISKQFYNKFNFSKLYTKEGHINLALGITSPNKGEGKTLVATNMAVSLARAYNQKTVIVDLNFHNPQLHKIFGGRLQPGLAEAMQNKLLRVTPTLVENLYLLTAGDVNKYVPGIKDTIVLREILYTLKREFDFIVVDMSSVFPVEDFPVHFINEMDGLISVVDAKNTKRDHVKKMYNHIDERRFVGYIFNRFNDGR